MHALPCPARRRKLWTKRRKVWRKQLLVEVPPCFPLQSQNNSNPLPTSGMAASGTTSMVNNADDEKVPTSLLDAFGSSFSLEQIASVYCKVQKDAAMAGIMLCDMQELSSTNRSNGTWLNVESIKSPEVPSSNYPNRSFQGNGNAGSPNQNRCPISAGSVSSVIGEEYSNPRPYKSASNTIWRPFTVNSKALLMSGPVVEDVLVNDNKQARVHKDMEDFLFSMLGDGFQLDRDVIRDVLGKCGYDMQKSMEKLFDVSALGIKRGDNCSRASTKLPHSYSGYERSPQDSTTYKNHSGRVVDANEGEIRGAKTLPNDVLHAFFYNSKPEKESECPAPPKVAEQSKGIDEVVSESRENFHQNSQTCVSNQQDEKDLNDEDDSYQVLRRAVQEYRGTMKEYYSAAIDAFVKGDHSLANKLMEQGNFFCKKARDADEESFNKIFDVRKEEEQKDLLLDLHEHDGRAAIRLLKFHVISLAGMPTFNHLKVIIETDNEDTSKGTRKRRVMRFLEKYSIKWVEDATPGTILIPLADIDPSTIVNKK
ncbi:hypothetical protein MLD38_019341 [Melastoma candidum]|uniref:Uncharacterized protein n=1 Tax=Melastoma candidum TaxID=119954 RepID=A0ACB9QW48_9MYRT|nr:hypothetical protein MLD38_019341 [Melastoma candidum]